MYYSNYNPFFMQNRNYMYNRSYNTSFQQANLEEEKKDIESPKSDTISFQDFYQNNNQNDEYNNSTEDSKTNTTKNTRFFSFDKNGINILGLSLQIDDLILIGLIILLLLDSEDNNLALIILLGLILLNVNLGDIINLF